MEAFKPDPNNIHLFRQQQERRKEHSQQEINVLKAGFASPFWGIMLADLVKSLKACRDELETCRDGIRIATLQGEIAALRVLLNTHQNLAGPLKGID